MNQILVALDIETTGFNPEKDEPIEIAAIKFQGNEILETFSTLINPKISIPQAVTHLTGINCDMVKSAPELHQIKTQLETFIANFPVVGHNIQFDINFLKAKGLNINPPLYDTLDLANIFLNHHSSLSLEALTRDLNLSHENKHRALDDTIASHQLFILLLNQLQNLPIQDQAFLQKLFNQSNHWLKNFISLHSYPDLNSDYPTRQFTLKQDKKKPDPLTTSLSAIEILSTNFTPRKGQIQIYETILENLNTHRNSIIEAATGSGKTLSYLLAACEYLTNPEHKNTKILISTHSNTLQHQILQNDYPKISKFFPQLKISLLKGKKKYFSREKFNQLTNSQLTPDEAILCAKLYFWIEKNPSGDLENLSLHNQEFSILHKISCDEFDCSHSELKPNFCYWQQAETQARFSDIIVVNHSLLIKNFIFQNQLLPPSNNLIIDEAHQLEITTTDALSTELNLNDYLDFLEILHNILLSLTSLAKSLNSTQSTEDKNPVSLIQSTLEITAQLSKNLDQFIEYLKNTYSENYNPNYTNSIELFPNPTVKTDPDLIRQNTLKIESLTENLLTNFNKITTVFNPEPHTELSIDLKRLERKLEFTKQKIHHLFSFDQQQILSLILARNSLIFKSTPIKIDRFLAENFFPKLNSVTLISATLTTNNNFNFILEELGIPKTIHTQIFPSPFNLEKQLKIHIIQDLPDPSQPDFIPQSAEIIKSITLTNKGKTLVLFTSKENLKQAFYQISEELRNNDLNILAQNLTGGKNKIISQFKHNPEKNIIFGTSTFWEGIDLPEQSLNCIIIVKLPFTPPNDPLFKARAKLKPNEFEDYTIPKTIIKIKQGIGRLIRSENQTGNIYFLDPRIITKNYGTTILKSLPENISLIYTQKSTFLSQSNNSNQRIQQQIPFF